MEVTKLLHNNVITVENFLDELECEKYIQLVNSSLNCSDGKKIHAFNHIAPFKNGRLKDDHVSNKFLDKFRCIGLDNIENIDKYGRKWIPKKCSKYVYIGKYMKGCEFGLHTDTGIICDNLRSRMTLLIYLCDNFAGGDTVFYDDNFNETVRVKPKKGMALLFNIDLWHKAEIVKDGVKVWIGTEILCETADEKTN